MKLFRSRFLFVSRLFLLLEASFLTSYTTFAMQPMPEEDCIRIWNENKQDFYSGQQDALRNILVTMAFGPLRLPGYESWLQKIESIFLISLSIDANIDDDFFTIVEAVVAAASEYDSRYLPIMNCLDSGKSEPECEALAVHAGLIRPLKDFLASVREHEKHAEVICRDDQ